MSPGTADLNDSPSAKDALEPSTGMPLAARRLLLIGGLAVPVGLVAGPYLFGLQLLAVAGIVGIALALSYGRGSSWLSVWSCVVAAAGAAWVGATIAYWVSVMAAANGSASAASFTTGLLVAAGVALVFTAASALFWYRRGRRPGSAWALVGAFSLGVWIAATIMCWLSIITAGRASWADFSSALFYVGVSGCLAMAAATAAACLSRYLTSRAADQSA